MTDRVKLPMSFDVGEMQADLSAAQLHDFIEYSVLLLTAPSPRGATAAGVRIGDYADGSWAEWHATTLLDSCPSLDRVVALFRSYTTVTLARLLRMAPGGMIDEHTDPTLGLEVDKSVIRLTVPIVTNDEAALFLNGTEVPMQPGECWYLRFTDPHRVVNGGPAERIHLSVDMIPNRWVRSLIADAAATGGAFAEPA